VSGHLRIQVVNLNKILLPEAMQNIEIIKLQNYGDKRGVLYNISDTDMQFLDKIKNTHFGKISSGSIRGNHYHHQTKEMLIITYSDIWTLAWAGKDSTEISKKEFKGSGAVLIKIDEEVAHSVKNNGSKDLEIIALSNRVFPKENPDTFSMVLLT
jgi:dTDP-4-dehydrorhamnose 3,5-epimerase-like enzyme